MRLVKNEKECSEFLDRPLAPLYPKIVKMVVKAYSDRAARNPNSRPGENSQEVS